MVVVSSKICPTHQLTINDGGGGGQGGSLYRCPSFPAQNLSTFPGGTPTFLYRRPFPNCHFHRHSSRGGGLGWLRLSPPNPKSLKERLGLEPAGGKGGTPAVPEARVPVPGSGGRGHRVGLGGRPHPLVCLLCPCPKRPSAGGFIGGAREAAEASGEWRGRGSDSGDGGGGG